MAVFVLSIRREPTTIRFGMALSPSTSALGATFNPFLFASLTENAEEHLNVVSVLARLDIDPWQEAAELSSLRGEAAADRLEGLLARCPAVVLPSADLGLMARRLIALLPRSSEARAPLSDTRLGTTHGYDPRLLIVMALMFEIAVVATLGGGSAHPLRDSAAATQSAALSLAAPSSAK
jgi:hypothetical protein